MLLVMGANECGEDISAKCELSRVCHSISLYRFLFSIPEVGEGRSKTVHLKAH